ncbi:unnamed protein product [Polarella glacialis]|uniref:Uncharacterized protein n=1 Tax=Polarella glacialis TaxID=89957 RepID=A0A813FQ61_POLGL|nr:unnamed protein product [Polarella glacialis]
MFEFDFDDLGAGGAEETARAVAMLARLAPAMPGAVPAGGAPVCGGKRPGDVVRGVEETFDGWVKLADENGWICKAGEALGGSESGEALEALDATVLLAEPGLARMPGRQMFEVAASAGVQVRREPAEGALVLGVRTFGEFVLAETQSYHGWVRLSDDEGWVQALEDPRSERWLLCVRPEELQLSIPGALQEVQLPSPAAEELAAAAREEAVRREALRQLEAAAVGSASAVFRAALEVARQTGVSKKDIARANAMRV